MNLELRAGVTHDFELGFRMGFRLDDGGQVTQADCYGRPFDTETYGTEHDRVANPELHFRWSVARSYAAELGLELRVYLPIEAGSRFGFMFGLPIALRAGIVRFDTGLYVPIIFYDPTQTIVSIPLHIWIQADARLLAGPAARAARRQPGRQRTRIPARVRAGLAAQSHRRSAHLVPVPGHEPQRGRALVGRRRRARSPVRVGGLTLAASRESGSERRGRGGLRARPWAAAPRI